MSALNMQNKMDCYVNPEKDTLRSVRHKDPTAKDRFNSTNEYSSMITPIQHSRPHSSVVNGYTEENSKDMAKPDNEVTISMESPRISIPIDMSPTHVMTGLPVVQPQLVHSASPITPAMPWARQSEVDFLTEQSSHCMSSYTSDQPFSTDSVGVSSSNMQPQVMQISEACSSITSDDTGPQLQSVMSNKSVNSEKSLLEHHIQNMVNQLKGKTKLTLDEKSPELLIKDIKMQVVPAAERIIKDCYVSLKQYVRYTPRDEVLFHSATSTIDKTHTWIQIVLDLYDKLEIYSMDTSKDMTIEIEKFTGQGTQTIYEFLKDFDSMFKGQGSDKQKADKLYRSYLSDRIRSQTSSISSEYTKLRAWLLTEFGDCLTVTDFLVSNLEMISKPSAKNYPQRAEYLLKVESVLHKLSSLGNETAIDMQSLQTYLHSQQFMKRLIDLLPLEDEIEYSRILARDGQDTRKVKGVRSFNHLVTFVSNEVAAMERIADKAYLTKASDEQKSTIEHATINNSNTINDDSNLQSSYAFQGKREFKPKLPPMSKGWFNPKWKLPCPMHAHDHEIADCAEFFSLPSGEKRRISTRKLCSTCLGPKEKCFSKLTNRFVCTNMRKARLLLCKGCVNVCKRHNILDSPFNFLLCQSDNHPKPSVDELSTLLKAYMPEMDVSKISPTIVVCVGSTVHRSVRSKPPKSKSSPVDHSFQDIVFDTSSGRKSTLNSHTVINEQGGSVVYIMQWLQIGSSKCLCFFDTGANVHMIDGQMAEKEKIRVITQSPTTLKVVGGKEVVTDYGSYRLNIGPDAEGLNHGLDCYGMSSVTGHFPKHDLLEVNQELRNHHQFGHFVANEVLPDYVGGSKVHLLLGIKLSVQPVHLFTLESGISVFRSPFKDIFGSDICYGGSHQSFKESKTSPQTYHAALFLNDEESASMSVFQATCDTEKVRDEMFTSVLDYVKDNDSMISTTIMVEPEACFNVFPSALGEEELKEAKENIVEYSNDDSQELHQGCVNSMNDIQSLSPDLYQEEYIKEGSEAYWDYAIKDFIVAQYEPEEHLNSSNASIFLPQACRGRRSKRKRKGSSGPATLLTLQS